VLLAVDLTNLDMYVDGQVILPRGSLHLYRSKFLWDGICHERVRIRNYGLYRVDISLSMRFESDFADIFEVPGQKREKRGAPLDPAVESSCAVLAYKGLDGVIRRSRIECSPAPTEFTGGSLIMHLHLDPRQETVFQVTFSCETDTERRHPCS